MEPKHKDVKSVAEADQIEALFVQTSHGMSYENGTLTLHTLAPTTLFFSDRPDRVTGHITSQEFVDTWDKGPDNFASNPPNAVLSIFHPDSVSDIVVELTESGPGRQQAHLCRGHPRRRDAGRRRAQRALHRRDRPAALAGVGGGHAPPRSPPRPPVGMALGTTYSV